MALHRASMPGSLDLVRLLLDWHSDIDAQDNQMFNALGHALSGRHQDVSQSLVSRGADLEIVNGLGKTACEMAAILLPGMEMPYCTPPSEAARSFALKSCLSWSLSDWLGIETPTDGYMNDLLTLTLTASPKSAERVDTWLQYSIRIAAGCDYCFSHGSATWIESIIWHCTVCDDVKFCGPCHEKQSHGPVQLADCVGHEFKQSRTETVQESGTPEQIRARRLGLYDLLTDILREVETSSETIQRPDLPRLSDATELRQAPRRRDLYPG